MDTNKILSADLLDLIFDDRNKAYGAYELRRTYDKRIKKALFITAAVAVLIFAGASIASSLKPKHDDLFEISSVTIAPIEVEKPPIPKPPQKQPEAEPVHTERFTTMQIVKDEDVVKPPPTQDDMDHARIDNFSQRGVDNDSISEPPIPGDGKGIVEAKPVEPTVWEKVEIDAKFDGNWENFLRKNLNSMTPVDNGAAAGRYKVMVRFVVDVDGTVSDITPLTTVGFGMEQEAVRVLKKASKWEPAFQNGRHVKAYRTQVIIFEVLGDE
jgi:periplasmic protein TonB